LVKASKAPGRASPAVKRWTIAVQNEALKKGNFDARAIRIAFEASVQNKTALLRVKLSETRMRDCLTCHGKYNNTSYLVIKNLNLNSVAASSWPDDHGLTHAHSYIMNLWPWWREHSLHRHLQNFNITLCI